MILEMALASAAVVVATALARAVTLRQARRVSARERRDADALASLETPRALRVGDVLLHVGDSLWLAGSISLDEEGTPLVLFRAPETQRAGWVAQLDAEAQELALLAESTEVPDGFVPDRLPIGGRLLSLRRRGRATVKVHGEHLPAVGPTARFTVLGDAGGRLAVVVDFEGNVPRLVLVGDRVERALIDVLPGGDLPSSRSSP